MGPDEWAVLIGGIAAIAGVLWYFLFSGPRAVAAVEAGGVQEIPILVEGGYEPAAVRVKRGERVRLVFDRREKSGCSEEVVLGDFGVRKFLPPFEKTAVEFTPERAGTYEFTCGMGMLRGRVIVE